MSRIFISASYSQRESFRAIHDPLKEYLEHTLGFEVYTFVYDHTAKLPANELMRDAFVEIDKSDLVVADLSNKSVGVGIECGYAYAKGIPIIYICHHKDPIKETMEGISSAIIEYRTAEELTHWHGWRKYFS